MVAWVAGITRQDGKGVGGREFSICINIVFHRVYEPSS